MAATVTADAAVAPHGAPGRPQALWLTDQAGIPRLTSRSFPAPAIPSGDREILPPRQGRRAQAVIDAGYFVDLYERIGREAGRRSRASSAAPFGPGATRG